MGRLNFIIHPGDDSPFRILITIIIMIIMIVIISIVINFILNIIIKTFKKGSSLAIAALLGALHLIIDQSDKI